MRRLCAHRPNSAARLRVIAIDYAQLVRTPGNRSRYERMSDVCEEARILANRHHLVVILVSQIHRPRDDNGRANATREVTLHDAKDSGSFENSCSLILGRWNVVCSRIPAGSPGKPLIWRSAAGRVSSYHRSGHMITAPSVSLARLERLARL
jgi:hypothetical protein